MAKGKSKYEMRNGITPNGLVVVEVTKKDR